MMEREGAEVGRRPVSEIVVDDALRRTIRLASYSKMQAFVVIFGKVGANWCKVKR